jgi:hypothetical protein
MGYFLELENLEEDYFSVNGDIFSSIRCCLNRCHCLHLHQLNSHKTSLSCDSNHEQSAFSLFSLPISCLTQTSRAILRFLIDYSIENRGNTFRGFFS